MFETFRVGYFYVAVDSVLSLYAAGIFTGAVLSIGGGVTHIVPILDGYYLPGALTKLNLAGNDLDTYM